MKPSLASAEGWERFWAVALWTATAGITLASLFTDEWVIRRRFGIWPDLLKCGVLFSLLVYSHMLIRRGRYVLGIAGLAIVALGAWLSTGYL